MFQPWPALVSVHCAELVKTAEIQPCCAFSPEAPPQLQRSLLEGGSNEGNGCSCGSVGRGWVFPFCSARVSIPLFLWGLSIRIHAQDLAPTSPSWLPGELGCTSVSSTEERSLRSLTAIPFHPGLRGGGLALRLETSGIAGCLVNSPS